MSIDHVAAAHALVAQLKELVGANQFAKAQDLLAPIKVRDAWKPSPLNRPTDPRAFRLFLFPFSPFSYSESSRYFSDHLKPTPLRQIALVQFPAPQDDASKLRQNLLARASCIVFRPNGSLSYPCLRLCSRAMFRVPIFLHLEFPN
jgi:hypothetical protein